MIRKIRWLIVAIVILAIGASAGYVILKKILLSAESTHLSIRSKAILSHASQRDWNLIVLGDSHTELAVLNNVCGEEALNAGISGGSAKTLVDIAYKLSKSVKPKLFLIAVGTNDSRFGDPTSQSDFSYNYKKLISYAVATGARVHLVDIPPVGTFGKASAFDPDRVAAHNREIRSFGLPVANVYQALSGPDGLMLRKFTDDGVHPNSAGYIEWLGSLERSACK